MIIVEFVNLDSAVNRDMNRDCGSILTDNGN